MFNLQDIPKVLCEPPLRGNLFSASEIAWESLHLNHSSTFSPTNLKYVSAASPLSQNSFFLK